MDTNNRSEYFLSKASLEDPILDGLVADIVERLQIGEQVRLENVAQDFPQYHVRLRSLWPTLVALANMDQASYSTQFTQNSARSTTRSFWPTKSDQPYDFHSTDKHFQGQRLSPGQILSSYKIQHVLGAGGMGVVYQAFDQRRQMPVALKTLPRQTPQSLYRFKNEFRSLAGVTHPNLVNLYELIAEDEYWFFTMELVEGLDFLKSMRMQDQNILVPQSQLRDALIQLVTGIQAIHTTGRLHRDLKPGNVMVTPTGRVVILDFGLSTPLPVNGLTDALDRGPAGTIRYMAPEQFTGQSLTPASDWYSFGTLLYQVLTGEMPFDAATYGEYWINQVVKQPEIDSESLNIPEDLAKLTLALLQPNPNDRPTFDVILETISSQSTVTTHAVNKLGAPLQSAPLVGRDLQQATLQSAFQEMLQNRRTVFVDLQGRSGVGKSSLVEQFVADISHCNPETIFLRGRCYEHESVPFKAFDSIVDSLARFLSGNEKVASLLPIDVAYLARVFPVLRQVNEISNRSAVAWNDAEAFELRKRAFQSLRNLLSRIADHYPLVVTLDDLQWGDVDSAALLGEILQMPGAPAMMWVVNYRSEEVATSSCLREVFSLPFIRHASITRHSIHVEPLTPEATRTLAKSLLGNDDSTLQQYLDQVTTESCGNPFFVFELVQSILQRGGLGLPQPGEALALETVLWDRIMRLGNDARELLEVAAVHGRPLAQTDAWLATGNRLDERPALSALRSGHLIRSTGPNAENLMETYHDRVREIVIAKMLPGRKRWIHQQLAGILKTRAGIEPEILAEHFHGAGDLQQASENYRQAASQAAETMAFSHAARLYQLALQTGTYDASELRWLQIQTGEALANAGRGADAAEAYLKAVDGASSDQALDLKRLAAQQLLTSGRIEQGLAVLQDVLLAVGLKLAKTQRTAFWSLLYHRVQLELRGLRFSPRKIDDIPAETIKRIDIGWAASLGMSMNDNTRAADIQTRHLLLALKAGEPMRIARALAMEVPHMAGHRGQKTRQRAAELSRHAEELARDLNDPYLSALVFATRGVAIYLNEEWEDAINVLERSEKLFSDNCRGVVWEMATVQTFELWCLQQMGEWSELAQRCPEWMRQAQLRGDLYALTNLRCFSSLKCLMEDDIQSAHMELDQAESLWSQKSYHIQHYAFFQARVSIFLYAGDVQKAWDYACEGSDAFSSSFLNRIQLFRIHVMQLRAYAAIALAASPEGLNRRSELIKQAAKIKQRLRGENTDWANAIANYLETVIPHVKSGLAIADSKLLEVQQEFVRCGMQMFASALACRRRSAVNKKSHPTATWCETDWMSRQNIVNPSRFTNLLAPGFP